ncbi:MAG: formylglycine-generating enzyme family protein [Cyanobacteriota bacterium]
MASVAPSPSPSEAVPWQVLHWRGRTQVFTERVDGLTLPMVRIPAGSFRMGSPPEEEGRSASEGPVHTVRLEEFLMGRTPITQEQWRVVAQWEEREGEQWGKELMPNPSRFQPTEAEGGGERLAFERFALLEEETTTDQRPVERVIWHDAMEFCHRLSQRTGRTYTLPSEAQWEYACRAGTATPFAFGDTLTPELANYDASESYADGPKGVWLRQTTPVGRFPANAWGLKDMHGNVWEWCLDHWHDNYGEGNNTDQEKAPDDGSAGLHNQTIKDEKDRLLRGGSWGGIPRNCRSAVRFHVKPVGVGDNVGFRVVCLPQGRST